MTSLDINDHTHADAGFIDLKYGETTIAVTTTALNACVASVMRTPVEVRMGMAESIRCALDRNLPRVSTPSCSQATADEFYYDMMMWEALKRLKVMC